MTMIKHDEILSALRDRKNWEDKQATYYQLRHDGLRRRNKPWPNAADLHFPLVDTLIEKTKPGYVGQIFATETVASFTAVQQDFQPFQSAAGQWFDYQLKQESNFEEEITIAVDKMLMGGKGLLKTFWNADDEKLTFESVDPKDLIVPPWTNKVQTADWLVHVQRFSKHAYARLPGFKNDQATIDKLAGARGEDSFLADNLRFQREGITKATSDSEIVVWEVFERTQDNKVTVRTYSPADPKTELRPEFGLPYNQGEFADKKQPFPFFELNGETKDRGYYSPRGIAERTAPFEAKLCKDWNTDSDYKTFSTAPQFFAPNGIPNTANLKMVPGQILPFPIQAVTLPPVPPDLMLGMQTTRQVAQELIGVIDYGATGQSNPNDRKTATEVNLIGNVMGQSTDLRARTFRRELTYGLKLAWSILVQYRAQALSYFFLDELMQLPVEAIQGKYRIELNGSGDNNNRQLQLQKAVARHNMHQGKPWVDQIELTKSVLEADDPRLVKRLVINQGSQNAMQVEDQAQEISILLLGFPAEVRPTDDDASHLASLFGFLERRVKLGQPIGPETLMLMAQHAQQHEAQGRKKQPQQWQQQVAPQFQMPLQQLMAAAQAAQQSMMMQQQAPMPGAQPAQPTPMPGALPGFSPQPQRMAA